MALADILLKGARSAKVPRSFVPLLQQAISEAAVRYSPEYDQLSALREQSAGTLRQRISQANSAAQLQSALANETLRNVNANTNPAIARLTAQQGAPAGSSQSVVAENLGLTGQGINALLSQAAANAPIRAQQQIQQALAEHEGDLGKITGQRQSLFGQAGTFVSGRYGDLTQTDRSNRAKVSAQKRSIDAQIKQTDARITSQERGQDLSHQDRQDSIQQRRQAAARRAADKKKAEEGGIPNPGNVNLAPPATQAAQVAKINGAFANVKNLMSHPQAVKGEVETLLRAGKVDGVKYTQDQIDVAFDRYRNKGRVSNRGARKLHTMGVSVRGHYQSGTVKPARKPIGPPSAGPAGPLS